MSVSRQCQAQKISQKALFKRSKIGHRYDENGANNFDDSERMMHP